MVLNSGRPDRLRTLKIMSGFSHNHRRLQSRSADRPWSAATPHGRARAKMALTGAETRSAPLGASDALRTGDRPRSGAGAQAFTLIELMVVMAIIGLLASITVPALKGLGTANRSAAAHRQILDDLALARLRAINDRAPVYMVFVPTNVVQAFQRASTMANTADARAERSQLTNLLTGAYSSYALVAERTVGDQPGRHTRRYLTEWRSLPEGVVFAPFKLMGTQSGIANEYNRTLPVVLPPNVQFLPFPNARSAAFPMPYIAFNAQGQLISQRDEVLAIAKGSVFTSRRKDGGVALQPPDVQLVPTPRPGAFPSTQTNTYQFVRINWLTGRARVELPQVR